MDKTFGELLSIQRLSESDFEKFALTILQFEAMARGKTIYRRGDEALLFREFFRLEQENRFRFDAIAPSGIDDSFFTIVEVKKTSKVITEGVEQIKQVASRFHALREKGGMLVKDGRISKLLLVISGGQTIKQSFLRSHGDWNIEIWSIDELVARAKMYPLEFNAFLELVISRSRSKEIITAAKSEAQNVSDRDLVVQNDRLIGELNNCFRNNRISLVLGTGVSMDYNDHLSWNALSDRLYSSLDPIKQFKDPKNSFSILGGDNISAVEYAKRNLSDRYPSVLHKLLYPKKNAYRAGNSSLDECADLIVRQEHRLCEISKVITYNYDDFLEQSLLARGHPFHVLYRSSDYLNETTAIYHVHGYVPERCKYDERREYINTVVLSEEDYFSCYSDATNWNVAIQVETFKDDVCIFIGNSITDFNEKRLLNKTRQETGKSHFAIIYTKGLDFPDLSKIYMHFFYELNVKIIWAKSLTEIPIIIKRIGR